MDELLNINGARLRVISEGSGIPLLLFNGGPGCSDYLGPVAGMLSDLWTVVRFEPRGCGGSDWDGNYGIETTIADAEAIRAHFGFERMLLGGHSFGPGLALAYALAHPGRASGLLSICGGSLLNDRSWAEDYHRNKAERGEDDGGIVFNADPEVNRIGNKTWREYIKRPALLRELADLQIPALFIAAGNDIRPNWPIQQTASLLPQGKYVEIPGAGHYFWLSHADELREHLRKSLEEMAAASA
ncbi:alpha/beta hydrolase [bacterium]|nr:alpha/beta hydrolase [bacterium]